MALHLKRDHRGRQYFAISCDDCGTRFTAFDDGCYHYASLRLEAVLAGWDAPTGPDPAHRCPDCVGDGNRVRRDTGLSPAANPVGMCDRAAQHGTSVTHRL